MRVPVLLALGLSAIVVGCAPTTGSGREEAASSARQCFSTQTVRNFRQGRPDQVFLRVGRDQIYELNAAGCRDLDFANRLALVSDVGGVAGSRLCTGDWARVLVPGSTTPHSVCRVRLSRMLTQAEVAALPAAHRP